MTLIDALKMVMEPLRFLINKKAENLDWNENDPSSRSYIKNRPFYTNKSIVDIMSRTVFFEDGYSYVEKSFTPLIDDETYTIIFDGDQYNCKAHCYSDGDNEWCMLGNLGLVDEGPYTNEPFFIYINKWCFECYIPMDEYWECDIRIFGPSVTIRKIPSEYLPDIETIGRKGDGENAEVFNGGEAWRASGIFSHAEGVNAEASGDRSHAEGMNTIASGVSSHAEGEGSYANGDLSHAEGSSTASGFASHSEGNGTSAFGDYSHAEGSSTFATTLQAHAEGLSSTASGQASHAEGNGTTASGSYSHSEGSSTQSKGTASHSEGSDTIASGGFSHAEGAYTKTGSGQTLHSTITNSFANVCQHAEGYSTLASGNSAHAEGQCTTASGRSSHAEGEITVASAYASHAEGTRTTANSKSQHVQGEWNILDIVPEHPNTRGTYAHIVGNGTNSNNRSNAHTLDWNGLGWFAGGLKVGGTGQDDETAKTVIATTTPTSSDSGKVPVVQEDGSWGLGDVPGGGGSAGGGSLVVVPCTITGMNGDKVTGTCEMTATEIAALMAAGKIVYLNVDGTPVFVNKSIEQNGEFHSIGGDDSSMVYLTDGTIHLVVSEVMVDTNGALGISSYEAYLNYVQQ